MGIIGLIGGFISSFLFYKLGTKSKKIVYSIRSEVLVTDNIESTITNNSNPLNLAKPIIIDSSTIAIEYDYFSHNDIITFTFFHTGNLNVTGKIKMVY